MDYRFTEEEEVFRKEVRDFLQTALPSDWLGVDQDMNNQNDFEYVYRLGLEIRRKLGEKGWLEISWPKEYGGQDASLTKQLILEEELYYQGVPGYDQPTFGVSGPLIMQFGTEEQKKRFLPSIARGKVKWAIGMSEPGAGSDFAALQLRAVEERGCYALDGQKTWQSGCHMADWCMVFARTDPDLPNNRGISVFLVDLTTPGITMRRIAFMTGVSATDEVFYQNVRVPKDNLLGEKGEGWQVAIASFALDRFCGFQEILRGKKDFELLLQYCRETCLDGQPLAHYPLVRNRLAEMAVEIEVGYNLGQRVNWKVIRGMSVAAESCQLKVLGAKVLQHLANLGTQILGLYGQLDERAEWGRLRGRIRHMYLSSPGWSIGGGTSEVSKNFIATVGLGLPRA